MRRAELLITHVRRATENVATSSSDAITDEEFLQYLNDGQFLLQRRILAVNDKVFRTSDTFSADGSESYSNAPFNIFSRNRVAELEYSESGLDQDYYKLDKRTALERRSVTGRPSQYILESQSIIVNSYPSTGTFRRTYNFRVPRLDKRRSTVSSSTASATALTALTLTTTSPFTAADYDLYDHLTIVGSDGTVKMRGIPYTAVDSGTGVVSILDSSYTFPEGSTIANGDHVVLGEYATTHSLLDDQCEDFLLTYCQKRIFMRDSSSDAVELLASDLDPMIQDILEIYSDDPDNQQIPITNFDYFQDLD